MNILELSKPFNHGGMAEHILTLSTGLNSLGHKVIVGSNHGDHVDRLLSNGITHHDLSFTVKNPFGFLSCAKKLKKIILDNKIDIVHCHYRACAMYMRYLQVFRGVKVPFIWSNHLFGIPNSKLYKKFTFTGEKVIAVSNELKNNLIKAFDIEEEKIVVVNNGIDISHLAPASDIEKQKAKEYYGVSGKTVCSILGRLVPVKGHDIAIEALDKLRDREELVFIFAGNGEDSYKECLQKKIKEKNLANRIFFVGQTDTRTLLSASDVMILPSYKEGFPLSVIEAFAMRTPVVRTKTSGYDETKDYCLGAEIGNSEDFAQKLKIALDDKEKMSKLVQSGFRAVLSEWTTSAMTEKILAIYKEVIKK